MIVISNSLVLSPAADFAPNNPVIGWHNLVTTANVTASSEAAGYPITNVANPITAPLVRWQAAAAGAQTVAVDVSGYLDEIDYIAIARHNLGSEQIPITVEGSTNLGVDWFELVQENLLPDDAPAIFQFEPQALTNIRLSLGAADAAPSVAVVYVGKLLTLQRRIYVGHVPIKYGRASNVVNGKSEGGDFLGRIVLSEETGTAVDLDNITPGWYRATMDPFIKTGRDVPFFFAWRPAAYPNEVGYCWITNNPQPQNQRPNGMMQIQLQMTGIAP